MVAGVAVGLVGPRTIDALFMDHANATVNVSVSMPTIPRPASFSCVTGVTNGPLGVPVDKWAAVSWTPPSGFPAPTEYVIRVLRPTGEEVEIWRGSGSAVQIRTADLTLLGTVGWLINLLLSSTVPLTVNTVYGTHESAPVWTRSYLRGELLPLGALGCANTTAGLLAQPAVETTSAAVTTTSLATPTTSAPSTTIGEGEPTTTMPVVATTTTTTTTSSTSSTAAATTTTEPVVTTEPATTTTTEGTTTVAVSTTVP